MTVIFVLAIGAAAAIAATASREPFAERLVRLEASAAAPELEEHLHAESVVVNAAVLQLADTPELRLNAALSFRRYPAMTRDVLSLYAGEREFQEVFARFGPAVMPPISYFLSHEVRSLEVLRAAGSAVEGARRAASRLMGGASGRDSTPPDVVAFAAQPLTPEERGWYAVAFIAEEGHDFLGQFVVDANGQADWVQTERLTEAAAGLFTSGIRSLEVAFRRDEEPELSDYLWAGVDVTLTAGALKAIRLGRAAGAGARGTLAARTVVRGGRAALRVGRFGVPAAVAYAVVRHPSLVSGFAAQAARVLGWPVAAVQAAVWFVVLLPALVVLRVLLRALIRPTLWLLALATRGLSWLLRQEQASSRVRRDGAGERVAPRLGALPPIPDPRNDDR